MNIKEFNMLLQHAQLIAPPEAAKPKSKSKQRARGKRARAAAVKAEKEKGEISLLVKVAFSGAQLEDGGTGVTGGEQSLEELTYPEFIESLVLFSIVEKNGEAGELSAT